MALAHSVDASTKTGWHTFPTLPLEAGGDLQPRSPGVGQRSSASGYRHLLPAGKCCLGY